MLKHLASVLALGLLAPVASAAEAPSVASTESLDAEASPVDVSVGGSYGASNFFRGVMLWDGVPSVFPTVDLGIGDTGLSANVTAYVPLSSREALVGVRDEVDVTASYGRSLAGFDLAGGAVVYLVPTAESFHAEELFVSAARSFDGGFGASAAAFYSLNSPGMVVGGDVSWAHGLPGGIELSLAGRVSGALALGDAGGYRLDVLGPTMSLGRSLGAHLTSSVDSFFNYNPSLGTTQQGASVAMAYTF